jgi:hypothetical protein
MLSNPYRIFSFLVAALALVGGPWRPPAARAQSEILDVQVSEPNLIDPEFDQVNSQFVWITGKGELWIGKVDPVTGDFTPPSGKNILIDTLAVPAPLVGNGPEWVYTSSGPEVVYTRFTSDGHMSIARAKSHDGGTSWVARVFQSGKDRFGPFGSLDLHDPTPRITYIGPGPGGTDVAMWRELDEASTEEIVPNSGFPGGRWVSGKRAIVFTQDTPDGLRQVFLYDVDTKRLEQITHDEGVKSATHMWAAPEYDNQYVLSVLTDDTHIGIYREIGGVWTKIYTVKPPSLGDFLWSPEPFVYNEKSYIVMVTSTTDNQRSRTVPTDIWLAGIDFKRPFYRQVSDSTVKVRKDPEVFITTQGPFVYYLSTTDNGAVFRADTRLGPLPPEVRVTDLSATILDPEFDQENAQFVWVSDEGEVWIGKVDPVTGDFTPPSGKHTLVDTFAVPVLTIGNGPEWVYTSSGPQIVYTKFTKDLHFAIARAKSDDGGVTWGGKILGLGEGRFGPIGSLDRGDLSPRISYVSIADDGFEYTLWRELEEPFTEETVPGSKKTPGARWAPGHRALILPEQHIHGREVFVYDVDTKDLAQITDDDGEKKSPFIWQAPEFNNAYVFLTLIDETHIGIYRKIQGIWTRINTIKPPSIGNFLWSPEPFVYNGKSYIVMVTSKTDDQQSLIDPTDIWLAGIDPTTPFYRQLSDSTIKVRKDPEVFITQRGAFIYYTPVNPDGSSQGVYRTDTRLGPPR